MEKVDGQANPYGARRCEFRAVQLGGVAENQPMGPGQAACVPRLLDGMFGESTLAFEMDDFHT